ncbi:MAG: DNA polymerase III subunit beta [Bacteroidales bacterium]|nr:DNA polymerase III subunit beta [Bacteroidales bacterium]
MNFVVQSTVLASHLQSIGRVINSKNSLPILDNYLFELEGNNLTITASDLETTFITTIQIDNSEGDITLAVEAKKINEIVKELGNQPLTFNIDSETLNIDIVTETGKFSIKGVEGIDFPKVPGLKEESKVSLNLKSEILFHGINSTLFATADDELRPVMNGVFFEINVDNLTFVASDAHKLVKYSRKEVNSEIASSFILPKKPANLLKNILSKDDTEVMINFDGKNAHFTLPKYKLVCRLVEGNFPNYSSVIPTENPNVLEIDRLEFYNTLKRVSIFSNQASNLVRLHINANQLKISAQDIDFSVSAHEHVNCSYDGDELEIGFKSIFLMEILQNISTTNVSMEFSDPTRAGIVKPHEKDKENENEDVLMLLMPMMINA